MAILGPFRQGVPKRANSLRRDNMKKAEMKVYRDRLLDLRARLRGDVTSMTHAALRKGGSDGVNGSSMPIHMAELGSDNFEQEFTLSLLANEEDRLGMIETALQRIEDGNYGLCEQCDGVIPKTRLNAIPYTPLCIKCAASRDERAPLE
jgi:DnaK suppressor protein